MCQGHKPQEFSGKWCDGKDSQGMIKTERLLLRELRTEDLADFFELMSCAEVVRFEPYSVMNLEEAEKELERRVSSEAFWPLRSMILEKSLETSTWDVVISTHWNLVSSCIRFTGIKALLGRPASQSLMMPSRRASIGCMPNVIQKMQPHGTCWNVLGFREKVTFGRMCIFTGMIWAIQYGKILICTPC